MSELSPSADAVLPELLAVIRDVFGRPGLELSSRTVASDVPGWDSFKMLEIVLALEARFGVTFTSHDIDNIRTTGDFAIRIADKLRVSC